MTFDQFMRAMGLSQDKAQTWYEPIENAIFEHAIVSPFRAAMFLATIGHESGNFRWLAEIWGPTAAQKRYDSRDDLGNTDPQAVAIAAKHGMGPGQFYRGYGPIQITGFYNLRDMGEKLGLDLINEPSLLMDPRNGARSSARWWQDAGCNAIADTGNFFRVSNRVNRGNSNSKYPPNGWEDRLKRYNRAIEILG